MVVGNHCCFSRRTQPRRNPSRARNCIEKDSKRTRSTTFHCLHILLAARAQGPHPFPSRTRPLSPAAPMVLRPRGRGRVGRRRHLWETPSHTRGWGFRFVHPIQSGSTPKRPSGQPAAVSASHTRALARSSLGSVVVSDLRPRRPTTSDLPARHALLPAFLRPRRPTTSDLPTRDPLLPAFRLESPA